MKSADEIRATEKQKLIAALREFAEARPRLEYANYGDRSAYRSESRRIAQQLADARALLLAVEITEGITVEQLAVALQRGYSGRLSYVDGKLRYCTGQYYPTEYRAAVCAVMAYALWCYWQASEPDGYTGAEIHRKAAAVFGRGIAGRWF